MGNGKLSNTLLSLGFFSALGTTENPGMARGQLIVKRGTPLTFDSNNGVVVVYDEVGRPWIRTDSYEVAKTVSEFRLQRGAYVPHSNDGGHFVREVLTKL